MFNKVTHKSGKVRHYLSQHAFYQDTIWWCEKYEFNLMTWHNIWMQPFHCAQCLVICMYVHVFHGYVDLSSSSSVPRCRVSHQCWLISCFDPVCLHVPAVDGDDDRCFMWHFLANNLLSYWFPAQIPCSALFQQMDIVPCCPSVYPSSFLVFLYFIKYLTWAFRTFFLLLKLI